MQSPARGLSSRHEQAIMRICFIAYSALFSAPSSHLQHRKSAVASNAAAPNMRLRGFVLRLEPCMARLQDVGQRGRTTIDVVLFHFLHYSASIHPIIRHRKSAKSSNTAAPNIRHAHRAFRLRPRNVTNRQSDTLVFCTFCIISCSSNPSFRHKKSTGASNAGAPNMRIAACLAA